MRVLSPGKTPEWCDRPNGLGSGCRVSVCVGTHRQGSREFVSVVQGTSPCRRCAVWERCALAFTTRFHLLCNFDCLDVHLWLGAVLMLKIEKLTRPEKRGPPFLHDLHKLHLERSELVTFALVFTVVWRTN